MELRGWRGNQAWASHSGFGATLRIFAQFLTLLLWGFDDYVFLTEKNKTKAPQVLEIRRVPILLRRRRKIFTRSPARHHHQSPEALKTARESALAEITEAYSASPDTTQPKIKSNNFFLVGFENTLLISKTLICSSNHESSI